jgi:hypothetical protein
MDPMAVNSSSPFLSRRDKVVQELDVRTGAATGPTADVVIALPAGATAASAPVSLLSNASATGAASAALDGGRYLWAAAGTFGGATLQLQSLGPDGTTWLDAPGAALTSAGQWAVDVGAGESLRVKVTGGSPSGLYAVLSKVR